MCTRALESPPPQEKKEQDAPLILLSDMDGETICMLSIPSSSMI